MSYAFQSPNAQVSSSLPPTHHHTYSHDDDDKLQHQQVTSPYSTHRSLHHDDDEAYEAPQSAHPDSQYHDQVGGSYDNGNPSRGLDRHSQEDDLDHTYADTRAGAGVTNDPYSRNDNADNMVSEKDNYGASPYNANRASGNSIWTKEDKRALASRSAPAKICRVIFGNIILAVILIVSIICLIVMFLRPPNVAISGISVPNQNGVSYENGAFAFNVTVDISVSNPNSISASIKKLQATAYDSSNQAVALGHGLVENQKIQPNANTTVPFPFQIKYDISNDPNQTVLKSIASDCGINIFSGSSGSSSGGNLDFLLKIKVDVDVLSITVPVNFNKDVSFPCPLSGSSLQGILGGLGSALTGSAKRALLESEEASLAAKLVRRELEKRDVVDIKSWMRDVSPVELMAAAVDGLVRTRSSPLVKRGEVEKAAEHDAL